MMHTMLKQLIITIIVLITAAAGVSADLYLSTYGSGWVGQYGTIRSTSGSYTAGGMMTPNGMYFGANSQHGAASFGYSNGQLTSATIRTSNVRGNVFSTTGGYAGSIGLGSRVHVPSYYHNGHSYGGMYAPMPSYYAPSTSSRGYVSTADYMRGRY